MNRLTKERSPITFEEAVDKYCDDWIGTPLISRRQGFVDGWHAACLALERMEAKVRLEEHLETCHKNVYAGKRVHPCGCQCGCKSECPRLTELRAEVNK